MPVKKELTIGLGLVSTLDMSEFKAVMSHEFGHFSQKSMTVGSYIMSANTIIHDMIFTRDKWDDILDQWRGQDLRIAFVAWIMTPIIWLIRQILNLFYQLLNLMYSLLSREMEFNADKVAVETSGSEAIVSGLWKLEKGFDQWNGLIGNVYLASQNNKQIKNVYAHLNDAWQNLESVHHEEISKLPIHELGGKQFFSKAENTKVDMYASHPPNNLREKNAKAPFVPCVRDKRSPWLLFDGAQKLQEEATKVLYKEFFNLKDYSTISYQEFEEFIQQEKGNSELMEEYYNGFQSRYLYIPKKEELEKEAEYLGVRSAKYFDALKSEMKELQKPVEEIQKKMTDAQDWFAGNITLKSIDYKAKSYSKKELEPLYNALQTDLDQYFLDSFKDWDLRFFSSHLAIAKRRNQEDYYYKLLTQLENIEHFSKKMVYCSRQITDELNRLQNKGEVEAHEITALKRNINDWIYDLNNQFESLFSEANFEPLPNIDTLEDLKFALIEGGEFKKRFGDIFEDGQFGIMMQQLEQSIALCGRVNIKNLEKILLFHKELY
jgi:hypothetical protein